MSKRAPNSLAALKEEKQRLKLESKKMLKNSQPATVAKEVVADYDVDVLFELGSLLFYPKKTRNMRIVSLAIPVLFIALDKAKDYLLDNEIVDSMLKKAEEFIKTK